MKDHEFRIEAVRGGERAAAYPTARIAEVSAQL
jgi:hypothetical protein